eukprot:scaffold7351_cov28-Tisochrysis_lutea.AAC.1
MTALPHPKARTPHRHARSRAGQVEAAYRPWRLLSADWASLAHSKGCQGAPGPARLVGAPCAAGGLGGEDH